MRSSTGERVVSSNWPKVDGENLYAFVVASRKSDFLDACERPPGYVHGTV